MRVENFELQVLRDLAANAYHRLTEIQYKYDQLTSELQSATAAVADAEHTYNLARQQQSAAHIAYNNQLNQKLAELSENDPYTPDEEPEIKNLRWQAGIEHEDMRKALHTSIQKQKGGHHQVAAEYAAQAEAYRAARDNLYAKITTLTDKYLQEETERRRQSILPTLDASALTLAQHAQVAAREAYELALATQQKVADRHAFAQAELLAHREDYARAKNSVLQRETELAELILWHFNDDPRTGSSEPTSSKSAPILPRYLVEEDLTRRQIYFDPSEGDWNSLLITDLTNRPLAELRTSAGELRLRTNPSLLHDLSNLLLECLRQI